LNWLERYGLDKKFLTIVQLMPDYLPMNKIKVEMSSFDSNKWIYIPKKEVFNDDELNEVGEIMQRDIERDPFPLQEVSKKALSGSFFGFFNEPVEMDERIIESGLQVLQCSQESKADRELEIKEQAHRDEIKESLDHLNRQLNLNIDKVEQKLDQLLNGMQNCMKAFNPQE
jgi:hypothetical protein